MVTWKICLFLVVLRHGIFFSISFHLFSRKMKKTRIKEKEKVKMFFFYIFFFRSIVDCFQFATESYSCYLNESELPWHFRERMLLQIIGISKVQRNKIIMGCLNRQRNKIINMNMCLCVCVHVCVRERERDYLARAMVAAEFGEKHRESAKLRGQYIA